MRGPDTPTTQRSRGLRRSQTDAERHLWRHLRNRGLDGHKFRRQVAIGAYFADFACLERRLVVELDGGQHLEQAARDATRSEVLRESGFTVLRFWNDQVLTETSAVLEEILRYLELR